MPPAESLLLHAVHLAHRPRQVAMPRVLHQVVVVAHQALRQQLRVEAVHHLRDDIKLRPPIIIIVVR
jgi:hypothetical protein